MPKKKKEMTVGEAYDKKHGEKVPQIKSNPDSPAKTLTKASLAKYGKQITDRDGPEWENWHKASVRNKAKKESRAQRAKISEREDKARKASRKKAMATQAKKKLKEIRKTRGKKNK